MPYLLQLEHGKYYVGQAKDLEKAFLEHLEGLGPAWTRIHRPIKILETIDGDLDTRVKEYMIRYGMDHVRGGSWEHSRLSDQERQELTSHARRSGCILS